MPSLHEQLMQTHVRPVLSRYHGRPGVLYRINKGASFAIQAIIGEIGGRQIADEAGVRQVIGGEAQVSTADVASPSTRDQISPDGGATWYAVNLVGEPKGGLCSIGFIRLRTQEVSLNARGRR